MWWLTDVCTYDMMADDERRSHLGLGTDFPQRQYMILYIQPGIVAIIIYY